MDQTLLDELNNIGSLNPKDSFNEFYDKSGDYEEIQKILNEIKKYDIFDFIARLSALNLVPENQNKSILFDTIISSILTINRNEFTSNIKMSSGKFRKIINKLNNLDLKMGVDPAENVFIENVMFYDNFLIFSGINYLPGYCLQMMIKILFLHKNNFVKEYLKIVSGIILLVLSISDIAASELGFKIEDVKRREKSNIIIPSSKKMNQMAELMTVDNSYINNIIDDNGIIEELYSAFGQGDIQKTLNPEQQDFFVKPFIKSRDDRTIILNISVLSSFAMHKIICLADRYDHKEELLRLYNESVWKDCRRSLNLLGHKKIKEKVWGIELLDRKNYKEVLLNVYNNQIMILTCICDDGRDYSEDSIFDMYPKNDFDKLLDKRMSYLHEKLTQQGLNYKDVFHIVIINSFGRGIMAGMNKKYHYEPLTLNPFELKCIAINERSYEGFLPRYIRAKSKLKDGAPNLFSELNSIEIYVNSEYSFYINDDFNPKDNLLYVAPGDSTDYIIRAVNKENRHLVESYQDDYLTEVVLNDEARNIYTDLVQNPPRASLLLKLANINIWIYSPEIKESEEMDLYFSIVDAISYWIAECKEIIESYNFPYDFINLQILLSGNIQEYYYEINEAKSWKDGVCFEISHNNIILTWTPESFQALNYKDNTIEKQMVEYIISMLKEFTIEGEIREKQLDKIFNNPLKKKFYTLDYNKNPYLKPLSDRSFRRIKSEDENELLDNIGTVVLDNEKWSYGIIKDEDRSNIAKFVVGYLYELLEKQIKKLKPDNIVQLVCYDLEKVMYNMMLAHSRYAYDVACYPEKRENIYKDYNELNKSSRALKFLAEYLAACPPDETKILGEWDYEKLLAICSLIIDWAYKNDLFYYRIFNTPVEILKSDRIGMKQDEFNKLKDINIKAREEQLQYYSTSDYREKIPCEEFPNIEERLNRGFSDEYGYSFDEFCNCIFEMITYGNQTNNEVKKADKSELITWLVDNNVSLNSDKVNKIIQDISLIKRESFLKPPKPYRKEDVYPWRFNRELSFTRRPVIIIQNEVIWGNRQLFHMLKFTLDLIYEGKLKTRGNRLTKLIGEISNKRGDDFNNQVFNKINQISNFIVDKNIKKINYKRIADENGNTLGDIDILYIIPDIKQIVLAEVKDFNFSKNPYEMDLEYQKMFVDKGDKNCFASKHKRRYKWVNVHLEDIKTHYGLEDIDWTVKDIFIVSEAIISNAFYEAGATIIKYDEISKESLQRV